MVPVPFYKAWFGTGTVLQFLKIVSSESFHSIVTIVAQTRKCAILDTATFSACFVVSPFDPALDTSLRVFIHFSVNFVTTSGVYMIGSPVKGFLAVHANLSRFLDAFLDLLPTLYTVKHIFHKLSIII